MALPIRPIPKITGADAERFIEQAEAVERNPHTEPLEMTQEEFDKIMETAMIWRLKNKLHSSLTRSVKFDQFSTL